MKRRGFLAGLLGLPAAVAGATQLPKTVTQTPPVRLERQATPYDSAHLNDAGHKALADDLMATGCTVTAWVGRADILSAGYIFTGYDRDE